MKEGTRSNYGYVFLDTIKNTPKADRPKVLLMENVPALVSAKFKEDYAEIHRRLDEMGYSSWGGLLNAKDYGVPQNRKRIFIVSILGEYVYKFPKGQPLDIYLENLLEPSVEEKYFLPKKLLDFFVANSEKQQENGNGFKFNPNQKKIAKTITTRSGGGMDDNYIAELVQVGQLYGGGVEPNPQAGRVYDPKGISPTLDTMQGGNRMPKIIEGFGNKRLNETLTQHKFDKITIVDAYNQSIHTELSPTITTRVDASGHVVVVVPEATKNGYAIAEVGDGIYIDRPHQKRGVVQKKMTPTLKTQNSDIGVIVLDGQLVRVRKLTPRECFRLMNIDDADFDKIKGVSNAQLYKQAGNAIVVGVLEKIFEQLL